jgi:rhamnose utilization protein RhaD (predicted bifunctional aldolase and dehydrogenase)
MLLKNDPEFDALLAYSAAIGTNPSLVQGAGGNTSLKRDGVLWVKASGTWLAHAQSRDIFVPVRLAPVLDSIHDEAAAENARAFVVSEENPSGLRPSIETTMHAALPHPVVVHVHCVDTMAWAARTDAETALVPLLAGLRWVLVPYIRPGAPLTRSILARMAPDTDVLVLGNHGLVVGGADTAAAGKLLAEVCRRLHREPRPAAPARMDMLEEAARGTDYVPAADPATHGTGTEAASLAVACRGSLYPDHVIFLGPGIVTHLPTERAAIVVPGAGVLLRRDASDGAVALARCLADVTARLDPAEPLTVLTPEQEAELLGWDAEKYRQSLDRP